MGTLPPAVISNQLKHRIFWWTPYLHTLQWRSILYSTALEGRARHPMTGSDTGSRGVIADRLNQLFDSVQPEGRPYKLREVADGINEQAGENLVSMQYLSQLRNGDRRKPSYEVVVALARWFGVKVEYFSDDETARRTDAELRTLNLLKDARVRDLAFRAQDLPDKSFSVLAQLIDQLRRDDEAPSGDDSAPRSS